MTGWRENGGVQVKDCGSHGVVVQQTRIGGGFLHLSQAEWADLKYLACNDPKPSLRSREAGAGPSPARLDDRRGDAHYWGDDYV